MQRQPFSDPIEISDAPMVLDDLPMSLESTRLKLQKAKDHLERYQAFLRLANIEIEQRNRYIIALTTFIYQASSVAQPGMALKLALVQALETTNTTIGAVMLVSDHKDLTLKAHKGLTPALIDILTGRELDQGAAALMPCLVSGDGALLEQKTASDDNEQLLLTNSHLTSLVSLPLHTGNRVLGALLIGLQGSRTFKPSELCFLMALSQETAVVLESLRLREGLWLTAETLLTTDPENLELPETLPEELNIAVNAPLPIPVIPTAMPEPAESDLEQLLAAVMEAEDEVQQQNADLQTLSAIAIALNRTLDLNEVLKTAVKLARETLDSDAAWVYLLDESNKLRLCAHTGLSDVYRRGMQCLKVGEGLEGQCVAQNRPVVIETVAEGTQEQKIWVEKEGLRAIAVVPLFSQPGESASSYQADHNTNSVVGVLAVGYLGSARQANGFSHIWNPREMRLLTSISNQVSLAIDNARLYSKLRDQEISARTGNEILNDINKMLLEKNNALAHFTETEIGDRVKTVRRMVSQLMETNLSKEQQQKLSAIGALLTELQELSVNASRQTDPIPTAPTLTAAPADKPLVTPVPPVTTPAVPAGVSPTAPRPASPSATTHNGPTKPITFAQAVAEGLVPAYIVDREKQHANIAD